MTNVSALDPEPGSLITNGDRVGHASAISKVRILYGFSLLLIALLAVIFMLYWMRELFIPIMFGVMLSYVLSPLVGWLQKNRIPRFMGAAVVLIGIVGGMGSLVYQLSDEAIETIELIPEAAKKLSQTLRREQSESDSAIKKVQSATTELEQAARAVPAPAPAAPNGVARVQIENPGFNIRNYLWSGMVGAITLAGQAVVAVFLAYYLLISGDSFRRKLIKISGSTISEKKITLEGLNEITHHIQRYLLVQLFTSSLVGLVTWAWFSAAGIEHASVWGIISAVLNMIPYIGALIFTISVALVTFLQFETISMTLLFAGTALLITNLESLLITPWLSSRVCQMNAVAIFVGLLFWGWLWGVSGLLLGVPILVAIKAICDRVDILKPAGEMLAN